MQSKNVQVLRTCVSDKRKHKQRDQDQHLLENHVEHVEDGGESLAEIRVPSTGTHLHFRDLPCSSLGTASVQSRIAEVSCDQPRTLCVGADSGGSEVIVPTLRYSKIHS